MTEKPPEKPGEVSRQLLEATFRRLSSVVISFPVLGLLVSRILRGQIDSILLNIWLVSLCLASVLGLLASWAFGRYGRQGSCKAWSLLRIGCAAFNGAVFGLAGTLLFVPDNLPLQAFMLLLIGGGAAAAVAASSAHLPSLLTYLSLSIVPAGIRLCLEGQPAQLAMSAFTLVFLTVLVGVGISANRLELRAARLTQENRTLIGHLEQANVDLNRKVAERTAELEGLLEANRESRAQLARFHVLLDHSGVGVLVTEPDSLKIVDFNETACRLLLLERSNIIGQTLDGLCLNPGLAESQTWHERLHASGRPLVLGSGAAGNTLELSLAHQEFEGVGYAVVVIRDATERVRLEEHLRRSQKMEAVGKLAGGIAHDFNNNLTAVIGLANMIEEALPDGDLSRADAQEIVQVAERASSLTKKLLALSRSGLEQPVTLDVNEVVRDLVKMLRRTFGQDIELVSILAEASCPVRMPPGELDQILLNLAINARDAMPQGGVLTVEVQEAPPGHPTPGEEWISVEVSDTGSGMDPDTLDKAFDPFFTTKGNKGHGLGLATCLALISRAGGHLSVRSEPGKGAHFTILLPKDKVGVVQPAAPSPEVTQAAVAATILVVEDQESVMRMVCRVLEQRRYKILQARSAEEALALLRDPPEPIDMLLSDIVLPGLSGVDLCRKLGTTGPALMLMSGFTEQAPSLGTTGPPYIPLLFKPFRPAELLSKVQEVLSNRLSPQEPEGPTMS